MNPYVAFLLGWLANTAILLLIAGILTIRGKAVTRTGTNASLS